MTGVKVTDYGYGTYGGQPLVLWNGRSVYHRHDHNSRFSGFTTFTEPFIRDSWDARPCKVCFR